MTKTSSKPKSEYAIQTVTNALRMLEVFHHESEMGVSDLARRLGLHKNNAFRLLATLELAGYIQQTPSTELYHLGPRCLELGHAFARSHTLMNQARPILEALALESGETAHLGVLSGRRVVHLDGVLPDQRVLTGLRVGERIDAHCTALGKVLLAGSVAGSYSTAGARPAVEDPSAGLAASGAQALGAALDELLSSGSGAEGSRLERYTEATFDDPTKLMDELRTVQMRGYATDVEEYAAGLRCVAAPVRDASARVVASISLSGPSMRLEEERLHGELSRMVSASAGRLSSELGSPV